MAPSRPSSAAPATVKTRLAAAAAALGFDQFGVAAPDAVARMGRGEALARFVALDRHGDMAWLADTTRRADPRALWPAVQAIVMVGSSYAPATDPLALVAQRRTAVIASYARRRDYHEVMKGRLKHLAQGLAAATGAEVKVFVDTAPVLEKPLAEAAGLGWQGKHTNLVSRRHGSWLFLGALFTTVALPPDAAETDHCGSCRRCLDICPTAAFPAPYELDARRCIAYLTIEHKGAIPAEFRAAIGNRIFGCDDCLAVCPWNRFAAAAKDARLAERAELGSATLIELAGLDEAGFRARYAGTPVRRAGRERFLRNVAIGLGNSADPAAVGAVLVLLGEPSPLIRAMAVWALGRLDPGRFGDQQRRRLASETDPAVRAEWAISPSGP